MRFLKLAGPLALAAASLTAHADVISVDLGNYHVAGNYSLSLTRNPKAWEASSVTWNSDNGHLYVIEDEGRRVYEVSATTGAVLSSMSLVSLNDSPAGFEDTEGLTYIGNGQFVLAEERRQSLYRFNYVAGGTLTRDPAAVVSLGSYVGNMGIEGITRDPLTGGYITVKETDPQEVRLWQIDFATGAVSGSSLFNPAGLGLGDLADVVALSTLPSLSGTADQQNLLILSQDSRRLVEVNRAGVALSFFDLTALSGSIEGVTIASNGNIYLVSEEAGNSDPHLYVLSPNPVPLPATAWLLVSGLGALALARRRREARSAG